MLWHSWFGQKEGHPASKNWVVGCWRGYLPGARCRLAYGPADATPLTVSCFSKIQIGFTFLVPAHPGSPRQRAIKRVCVIWNYSRVGIVQFGFTKIKGAKISLHSNSPAFRAAKLKGFTGHVCSTVYGLEMDTQLDISLMRVCSLIIAG